MRWDLFDIENIRYSEAQIVLRAERDQKRQQLRETQDQLSRLRKWLIEKAEDAGFALVRGVWKRGMTQ